MTQKNKMLLGVGVLAVAGYLLWKQSQKPKSFANLMAMSDEALGGQVNIVTECRNNKGTGNSRKVDVGGLFNRKVWQCCGNLNNYALNKPDLNCAGVEA